jgi:hypothetical protein
VTGHRTHRQCLVLWRVPISEEQHDTAQPLLVLQGSDPYVADAGRTDLRVGRYVQAVAAAI